MRSLLILSLFFLIHCGSPNSAKTVALNPAPIQSPQSSISPSPSPSPTPDPVIGVWQGQDYWAGFQDQITFNSDGTGNHVACGWVFNWDRFPNGDTTRIHMFNFNTSSNPDPNCQWAQGSWIAVGFITISWSMPYTTFMGNVLSTQTYSYHKQ